MWRQTLRVRRWAFYWTRRLLYILDLPTLLYPLQCNAGRFHKSSSLRCTACIFHTSHSLICKSENYHFIGPTILSHINLFKSIKCHTFSESQTQANFDDDDNNNNDDDNNNRDDNKVFFLKYQVSYLFGITSSIRFEWWWRQQQRQQQQWWWQQWGWW